MISQQLNTLSTVFLSKWIDTGDKMLDTTLVGIIGILVTGFITYISTDWAQYYNMAVFYLYRMYRNPTDLARVPYRINIFEFTSYEDYRGKAIYSKSLLNLVGNYYYDVLGNKNARYTNTAVNKAIIEYVEKRNLPALRKKSDLQRITCNSGKDVYPLVVGNSGNIVYFEYNGGFLNICSKSLSDMEYVEKAFIKEIVHIMSECNQVVETDEIYVPTFTTTTSGGSTQQTLTMKSLGKISKKKTFDTLFYSQKAELIGLLEKFQKGTLYPSHIPMDNKLGILLYGPPGTGKTGTISAIANMLGRSLLVINFTEITTCKQLDEILKPADYNKYVIVFDEFDCILDVISGKSMERKEEKSDWGQILLFAEGEERKNILQMMKEGRGRKADAGIDMTYLLQKLDGLESSEGRIIVATTNNPDKINPALMRPGRFDLKVCLGTCTPSMVIDILVNFYKGDEKMRSRIAGAQIPGGLYTPLQLINMAIQAPSLEKLLKRLTNKS
jgi:hypothetical protein